ncbi:MAG: short-chain dehydrogenase [Acidimicrobiia bacterium]|nr:MAG: short-chain dehydrogenase [Acidimicrobiia bacterium]
MELAGRLAVVTGGGSGMGRELVVQLAAAGCSVASCDVDRDRLDEAVRAAQAGAPAGVRVTAHTCDVADEAQVLRFRDEVLAAHRAETVQLLFNNAGIGGGGSFVADPREEWERVFAIDWWGVYHCCRAFVPLLVASDEAYLVNTSSVNGFWAALGPGLPHTAYSTAKFAVKGFSEALITDFRMNAPHVRVAVVMPGHIGTDVVANSARILRDARGGELSEEEARAFDAMVGTVSETFKRGAPVDAARAATIILDGVRADRWRILVGDDAHRLDELVRADPERAYEPGGPAMPTLFQAP